MRLMYANLQKESLPVNLHFRLEDPFIFLIPLISPLLQPSKFQCESWSELLQSNFFSVLEYITCNIHNDESVTHFVTSTQILTVSTHKDEITLVVECHYLSALKLWYLWE